MKKVIILFCLTHSLWAGAQTFNKVYLPSIMPITGNVSSGSGSVSSPAAATWIGTIDNDWFNPGNWDTGIPGPNTIVTIPTGSTNYPTILSNPAYCKDILFQSDSTGTATLLDNGNLTVNGIASVQFCFSGNDPDFHLITPPLSDAIANVFNDMYLKRYSEADNSWTYITHSLTPLNAMEGYALFSSLSSTNTVTFAGNLNFGSQSKGFTALTYGWNLMGNPYVSSIDWETVSIPSGMSNEVHYLEASSGNDLAYVKGTGGPGSQYIPPMQGFFIKASDSGTFSLGDDQRTHTGADHFYKSDNPQLLILEASGEIYSDQAWIHFNDSAGAEHDGLYDAYKLISSSNPALPQLYSITPSGAKLAINGMPEANWVSLGFFTDQQGIFIISAIESGELPYVYLEDLLTGAFTNLLTNNYTFTFNPGDPENRFTVHFTEQVAIPESSISPVIIYSSHKDLYVSLSPHNEGIITVNDMLGREILHTEIDNGSKKLHINQAGIYIIRVIIDGKVTTKKVII